MKMAKQWKYVNQSRKVHKWADISWLRLIKIGFWVKYIWYSESVLKTTSNDMDFIKDYLLPKYDPYSGAQWTVKNESRFWTEKNTSFYSEFNADSEYLILFKKYHRQKNGLTATCSLGYYSIHCKWLDVQLSAFSNLLLWEKKQFF